MKNTKSEISAQQSVYLSAAVASFGAVFAFILTLRKVENFDIWWHVKVGQWIVEHLSIPLQETFSHTMAGTPWTPHEWLAEVFFYLVNSLGNAEALSLFTACVAGATALCCWARGRQLGAGIWSLALFIVWAFLAARFRFMARPHILFFLLTSALLLLLEKESEHFRRKGRISLTTLIGIPVLLLCWVNTHGSFILGYVFFAAWAGQECIVKRNPRPLVFVAGCLPLVFLNPGGMETLTNIKDLFVKASVTSEIMNEEFAAPGFNEYPYFWSLLFSSGLLVLLTFTRKKMSLLEAAVLLGTAGLAVKSVRFIAIFALAYAPYAGMRLHVLSQSSFVAKLAAARRPLLHNGLGMLACLLLAGFGFANAYNPAKAYEWGMGLDEKTVPVRAATFLEQSNLQDVKLYNNFEYGGYLTYRLFPRFKIARDGRAEIFAPLNDAFKVNAVQEYQQLMQRYRFQVAVVDFKPSNEFEQIMRTDPFWNLVYWDDQALVYARKGGVPQEFLARWHYQYFSPFSLDYSYLKQPVEEGNGNAVLAELQRAVDTAPNSFKAWVYLGYVNSLMDKIPQAAQAYEKALLLNPELGVGHYGLAGTLAELYLQIGDNKKAVEAFEQHFAVHKPKQEEKHRYALILYKIKEYDKAETYFRDYLKTSPNDAMALANYGFLLLDKERYEEARQRFEASAAYQKNGPGLYGLALAYQKEGNCSKAEPIWEEFLQLKQAEGPIRKQAKNLLLECQRSR